MKFWAAAPVLPVTPVVMVMPVATSMSWRLAALITSTAEAWVVRAAGNSMTPESTRGSRWIVAPLP
ncbi:hypothetical protein D3C86_1363900 [compost metagenome]